MVKLAGTVHLIHPDTRERVTLVKGTTLPGWAEGLVTNPRLLEGSLATTSDVTQESIDSADRAALVDEIGELRAEVDRLTSLVEERTVRADELYAELADAYGQIADLKASSGERELDAEDGAGAAGPGDDEGEPSPAPNPPTDPDGLKAELADRDDDALRDDAEALGVKVDGRWGKDRLVDEIVAAIFPEG